LLQPIKWIRISTWTIGIKTNYNWHFSVFVIKRRKEKKEVCKKKCWIDKKEKMKTVQFSCGQPLKCRNSFCLQSSGRDKNGTAGADTINIFLLSLFIVSATAVQFLSLSLDWRQNELRHFKGWLGNLTHFFFFRTLEFERYNVTMKWSFIMSLQVE